MHSLLYFRKKDEKHCLWTWMFLVWGYGRGRRVSQLYYHWYFWIKFHLISTVWNWNFIFKIETDWAIFNVGIRVQCMYVHCVYKGEKFKYLTEYEMENYKWKITIKEEKFLVCRSPIINAANLPGIRIILLYSSRNAWL